MAKKEFGSIETKTVNKIDPDKIVLDGIDNEKKNTPTKMPIKKMYKFLASVNGQYNFSKGSCHVLTEEEYAYLSKIVRLEKVG